MAEGSNPLYNYYYSECIGLETISDGFFGLALWEMILVNLKKLVYFKGDIPQFAILHEDSVILIETPQITGYVTNGIYNIYNYSVSNTINYYPDYLESIMMEIVYTKVVHQTSAGNYNVNAD